jgi:hypothetical protein
VPDEFDDAVKVCDVFRNTGMVTECSLGTPRLINVRMNTTPSEAQKICVMSVEAVSQQATKLTSQWQLRIFSPFSGDHPIAVCRFKQTAPMTHTTLPSPPQVTSTKVEAPKTLARPPGGPQIQPCNEKSVRTGQMLRGSGSNIFLRTGPGERFDKIVNEKATQILKRTEHAVIDRSVIVSEECTQAGWSNIWVVKPDWLSVSHQGWVPSKVLRPEQKDASGKDIFTEEDFYWDKNTAPYKKLIVAAVNKIHREHSGCAAIDPMSAAKASSRGTKRDPVFFVTCGTGAKAFNVYFSKSDIEKGKVFHNIAD